MFWSKSLGLVLSLIGAVAAIPTYGELNSRTDFGSLVPGATLLEAHGPMRHGRPSAHYLSVAAQNGENLIYFAIIFMLFDVI